MVGLKKKDVVTRSNNFTFDLNNTIVNETDDPSLLKELVPGQYFRIPISAMDELDAKVTEIYDISLHDTEYMVLDIRSYVSNTNLRLKRNISDDAGPVHNQLLLSSAYTTLAINITVLECPPGFTIRPDDSTCTCDSSHLKGIWMCNRTYASISNSYWIGSCGSNSTQCTGHCPDGFCTPNISTVLSGVTIHDTHKKLCIMQSKH